MSRDLLVCTRKGLFHFVADGATYKIHRVSFLAENVTNVLADPHSGHWYAALSLGHFGAKLRRSTPQGPTWSGCAVPGYPEGETVPVVDGKPPTPATLK